jgi:hypothetical protein
MASSSSLNDRQTQLPSGLPTWITAELIEETITVWQPYYATKLTAEDAAEILQNVGRMLEFFESDSDEEVPCPSPRLQS